MDLGTATELGLLAEGEWSVTSLSAAATRYLAAQRAQRVFGPVTLKNRRATLFSFARFIGPDKPVSRVRRRDVERWLQQAQRHVTDSTVRTNLSAVKVFFRWCVETGLLRTSPAVGIRGPKEPERVPRGLEQCQVEAALTACPDCRSRLAFLLEVEMGLRAGEVAALQLGNIDFHQRVVVVKGKGGYERDLPIPDQVFEVLQEYRRTIPSPNVGYVIRSHLDPLRGIGPARVSTMVSRIMHEAQIPESGHALRHTLATGLVDEGTNIRTVQAILGHKMLSSTQRYIGKASLEEKRAVLKARRYGRERPDPEPPDAA